MSLNDGYFPIYGFLIFLFIVANLCASLGKLDLMKALLLGRRFHGIAFSESFKPLRLYRIQVK